MCGRRGIILRQIHLLPLASHDSSADFRRRLSQFRLLIGIRSFFLADVAYRTVVVSETIEQARMSHFSIAPAVAGLLVQHGFYFRGKRVKVLRSRIGELFGVERRR